MEIKTIVKTVTRSIELAEKCHDLIEKKKISNVSDLWKEINKEHYTDIELKDFIPIANQMIEELKNGNKISEIKKSLATKETKLKLKRYGVKVLGFILSYVIDIVVQSTINKNK